MFSSALWAPNAGHQVRLKAGAQRTLYAVTCKRLILIMAGLLRGGLRPQAAVSPAARRATRALWRRQQQRRRHRAALLAQVPTTHRPYNLPAIGQQLVYPANRASVTDRLPAPAGPQRPEGDRALLAYDDQLVTALTRPSVPPAPAPDASPFDRRRARPGGAPSWPWSCAMHATIASAAPTSRMGGRMAAAARLVLRNHDAGPQALARLDTQPGPGQAVPSLAPTRVRAGDSLRKGAGALAMATCRHGERRGVGEPGVSLDGEGRSLSPALCPRILGVDARREAPRPTLPEPYALLGPALPLWERR